MEFVYIIGVVFLISSIGVTVSFIKDKRNEMKKYKDETKMKLILIYLYSYTFFFLFIEKIHSFFKINPNSYCGFIILSSLGVFSFIVGFYIGVVYRFCCKTKVIATCIGTVKRHVRMRYSNIDYYTVHLSYEFDGNIYKEETIIPVSHYEEYYVGKKQEIYIDPLRPRICKINKRIEIMPIVAMLVGLLTIAGSIIVLIKF